MKSASVLPYIDLFPSNLIAETQYFSNLQIENWGLISYKEALDRQLQYVNDVVTHQRKETLILCSHYPVVTKGRATVEGDITSWSGEIFEVQRGGRATYHGPEQLVIYPIVDLNKRGRDIHAYLRELESLVLNYLKNYGIVGYVESGSTGVWVKVNEENKKIASIGIAVKNWTTYHGAAIYMIKSPTAYQGLLPCGFQPNTMVSLQELVSL